MDNSLMLQKLTHIDAYGEAKMVDVSEKKETERVAIAIGKITMKPETLNLIQQGKVKKGDALSVARLAGIMGAKKNFRSYPSLSSLGTKCDRSRALTKTKRQLDRNKSILQSNRAHRS